MSKAYWKTRIQEEQTKLLDRKSLETQKLLAKEYNRLYKETKLKLVDLYAELLAASADGTILVSDLYKFNRYYDLCNSISDNLVKLGGKEIKITEVNLIDMYKLNSVLVGDSFKLQGEINTQAMEKCLDTIWCADGKHWSERIWKNKALLQDRIEKGIVDTIAAGKGRKDLVEQLKKDFDVGFHEADRIARTELNYVQNQSAIDRYEQGGIEQYEFLAEIDSRTSEICKELNGKKFRIKDMSVGENFPPCHPYCRSTIIPVIK